LGYLNLPLISSKPKGEIQHKLGGHNEFIEKLINILLRNRAVKIKNIHRAIKNML
jgi:hypothetical protein